MAELTDTDVAPRIEAACQATGRDVAHAAESLAAALGADGVAPLEAALRALDLPDPPDASGPAGVLAGAYLRCLSLAEQTAAADLEDALIGILHHYLAVVRRCARPAIAARAVFRYGDCAGEVLSAEALERYTLDAIEPWWGLALQTSAPAIAARAVAQLGESGGVGEPIEFSIARSPEDTVVACASGILAFLSSGGLVQHQEVPIAALGRVAARLHAGGAHPELIPAITPFLIWTDPRPGFTEYSERKTRKAARELLTSLPTDAVIPHLLDPLRAGRQEVRRIAVELLAALPATAARRDLAKTRLTVERARALRKILQQIADAPVPEAAVQPADAASPHSRIAEICRALGSIDASERAEAIAAALLLLGSDRLAHPAPLLEGLRPCAAEIPPASLGWLASFLLWEEEAAASRARTREAAASLLAGLPNDVALPLLAGPLQARRKQDRAQAISALGRLKPDYARRVVARERARQDRAKDNRERLVRIAGQLAPTDGEALSAPLAEALGALLAAAPPGAPGEEAIDLDWGPYDRYPEATWAAIASWLEGADAPVRMGRPREGEPPNRAEAVWASVVASPLGGWGRTPRQVARWVALVEPAPFLALLAATFEGEPLQEAAEEVQRVLLGGGLDQPEAIYRWLLERVDRRHAQQLLERVDRRHAQQLLQRAASILGAAWRSDPALGALQERLESGQIASMQAHGASPETIQRRLAGQRRAAAIDAAQAALSAGVAGMDDAALDAALAALIRLPGGIGLGGATARWAGGDAVSAGALAWICAALTAVERDPGHPHSAEPWMGQAALQIYGRLLRADRLALFDALIARSPDVWRTWGRRTIAIDRADRHVRLLAAALDELGRSQKGGWGGPALAALAAVDTPQAIRCVERAATRGKSQALRKRARKTLRAMAAQHGVSEEVLLDQAMPGQKLKRGRSAPFSYGQRRLYLSLGFDNQLQIHNAQTGQLMHGFPTPLPNDDLVQIRKVVARYQELEAEIAEAQRAQMKRLEQAMLLETVWSGAAWRARFLEQPMGLDPARRLVFRHTPADGGSGGTFTAGPEGAILDQAGRPCPIEDDDQIVLAHPAEMDDDLLAAWRALGIEQPFPQLDRPLFPPGALTKARPAREARAWSGARWRCGYELSAPDWEEAGGATDSMYRAIGRWTIWIWIEEHITEHAPNALGSVGVSSRGVRKTRAELPPRLRHEVCWDLERIWPA